MWDQNVKNESVIWLVRSVIECIMKYSQCFPSINFQIINVQLSLSWDKISYQAPCIASKQFLLLEQTGKKLEDYHAVLDLGSS